MSRIEFCKMHGIGNDYVYINGFEQPLEDPARAAIALSDRHFGVGSDGLVLIMPSAKADFMMDMYNSDGSRGKMCGNAIRCVGKYVYERQMTKKKELSIETLSGIKTLRLQIRHGLVERVTVDMGPPLLQPSLIPVNWRDQSMVDEPVAVAGQLYRLTCLSMGNPHAVTFTDRVDELDLAALGPYFEKHTLFPDRINTEFVKVIDKSNLRMRVWERGSGETMACGSGACAALVAAVLTGRCGRRAMVHLNGGELLIEWPSDQASVMMTGPAAFVFDGQIDLI